LLLLTINIKSIKIITLVYHFDFMNLLFSYVKTFSEFLASI